MRVEILYFAVLRERLRSDGETVDFPPETTVAGARAAIAGAHPEVAALLRQVRCAVNRQFVGDSHTLCDGDELALIPPVAGGSARKIAVLPTALSLDEVVAAVTGRSRELLRWPRGDQLAGRHDRDRVAGPDHQVQQV